MATYTIAGHPLNPADLVDPAVPADVVNIGAALRDNGVGKTVTLTLSGASDAKTKGHGVFK